MLVIHVAIVTMMNVRCLTASICLLGYQLLVVLVPFVEIPLLPHCIACLPLLVCCMLHNEGEIGNPDAEEVFKAYCKLFTLGFGKEMDKAFLHPGFGYSPPFS